MAPIIKDKKFLLGFILVMVGILLILNNVYIIPDFIPWWVWSWQFVLIAIGIVVLLTNENAGPGIVLIVIGGVFLFPDLIHDIWPDFFRRFIDDSNLFWYLLIVVIGISLLVNRGKVSRHHHHGSRRHKFQNSGIMPDDYLDEVAIFGGGEKIITSDNFQGGNLTAIFGGSDLNLTRATLAPGVHELEVTAIFGGWTLIVPASWQIKVEVTSIFGGVSDKRMIGPDTVKDTTRTLVVKGVAIFGGGDIKSL